MEAMSHARLSDNDAMRAGRLSSRRRKFWSCVCGLLLASLIGLGANRVPSNPVHEFALQGSPTIEQWDRPTLSVGVFNIHGGKGDDGDRDLSRIAECLRGLDLVGLNEVHGDFRGHDESQVAELGTMLDRAWLFAPTERRWGYDHFGNGLLTSVGLNDCHRIPLPGTQHKKFRNCILASFNWQGVRVNVLVVHLDRVRDREIQLQKVCDLFLSLQAPAILMGDLNTFGNDPQLQRLLATEGVDDALADFVTPETHARRIDWIITRGLRTVHAQCQETIASDHPCLKAELELLESPEAPVGRHQEKHYGFH